MREERVIEYKSMFGKSNPRDTKNEAEFILNQNKKQKEKELPDNVIYVDFCLKQRIPKPRVAR